MDKGRESSAAQASVRADPLVPRCPYLDMLRGDPRCEAPGTMSAVLPASRRNAARGDVEG